MPLDDVRAAYGRRAEEYADALFDGTRVEAFPHAVTTAYFWPIEEMSQRLVAARFEVEATESRVDPGRRPHAAIVARRASGAR